MFCFLTGAFIIALCHKQMQQMQLAFAAELLAEVELDKVRL